MNSVLETDLTKLTSGDTIHFQYSGGSHPNKLRVVVVDSADDTYVCGYEEGSYKKFFRTKIKNGYFFRNPKTSSYVKEVVVNAPNFRKSAEYVTTVLSQLAPGYTVLFNKASDEFEYYRNYE